MAEKLHDSSEPQKTAGPMLSEIRFARAILRAWEQTTALAAEQLNKNSTVIQRNGEIIQNLTAENEYLRRDDVVPSFFSRRGAMKLLENDQELSKEFQGGNCGVIYLDVRFLKYINDTFSDAYGDKFLGIAAQKISALLDNHIRTTIKEVEEDVRMEEGKLDIRIRFGGDEFVVIVRNVTPEQLEAVADRLRKEFSVNEARNRSETQQDIPVVANVVAVHAGALPDTERQSKSAREILDELRKRLHESHIHAKKSQYQEIWENVMQTTGLQDDDRPEDDRTVAALFLMHCCSSFLVRLRTQLQ